jgi:hypothetical protein
MSQFISNLGPDFYVGRGRRRLAFQRVIDGPEEGGVSVSLVIDGEIHQSMVIDADSWASVLAHVCRAPHDGNTFKAAQEFHDVSQTGRSGYRRWRPDGWPYCPRCDEDELYSLADPATVETICGCYRCGPWPIVPTDRCGEIAAVARCLAQLDGKFIGAAQWREELRAEYEERALRVLQTIDNVKAGNQSGGL